MVLYAGQDPGPGYGDGRTAVAVDATSVYWTAINPDATTGGTVMKAPLCGGTVTTLATTTFVSSYVVVQALAVDASNVYWMSRDEAAGAPGGQIMMVPLGGGPSTPIASEQLPDALAVDATSVYWTDERTGTVMKAPLAGGAPVTLGPGFGQGVGSVAVDTTGVYWWTNNRGILKVALAGGQLQTLVPETSNNATVGALVVSGGSLYWASAVVQSGGDETSISSVPLSGGTPTTLATDPSQVGSIAVDGADVYWLSAACATGSCRGIVKKVAVGGGTPVTVASGWAISMYSRGSIAVDTTSVYWTSGNTVMKMTPK